MKEEEVIAVQERILGERAAFPHLQALGITNEGEDYLLLATFTRSASKKEKEAFVDAARPAFVKLGIQRRLTFFGE